MRVFVMLGLCALLGGCGLIARKEREEQMVAAKASMDQGFANCEAEYAAGGRKNHIAKTKCDSVAAQSIRPFVPYPDLLDQEWAARAVIAERLQAGKMTPAEANQQSTQMHAEITAEEQRRSLTGRAVSAQESQAAAAWRASSPVSCTRIGNTTNCY
jgi:hypothetical protein